MTHALIRPLAASLALLAWMSGAALAGDGPALLVHGNYCGPGNNAPLPPIDALDAACARHDACTPDGGLPSRSCNARLVAEASRIARDPYEAEDVRAAASLVAGVGGLIPSAPDVGRGYAGLAPAREVALLRHPELYQDTPSEPAYEADGLDEAYDPY